MNVLKTIKRNKLLTGALVFAAIAAPAGVIANLGSTPLQHISQNDAASRCASGAALEEQVRRESTGDYHYYPCYGGGEVKANQ